MRTSGLELPDQEGSFRQAEQAADRVAALAASGIALSARTLSELAALTGDLPPVSATGALTAAEVKDVVRIEQVHSGAVERAGRWVVPRRLGSR